MPENLCGHSETGAGADLLWTLKGCYDTLNCRAITFVSERSGYDQRERHWISDLK